MRSKKQAEHIAAYGEGNERRLTGAHDSGSNLLPGDLYTESGQALYGSLSAVSKPILATKYTLESSRRDLQITLAPVSWDSRGIRLVEEIYENKHLVGSIWVKISWDPSL